MSGPDFDGSQDFGQPDKHGSDEVEPRREAMRARVAKLWKEGIGQSSSEWRELGADRERTFPSEPELPEEVSIEEWEKLDTDTKAYILKNEMSAVVVEEFDSPTEAMEPSRVKFLQQAVAHSKSVHLSNYDRNPYNTVGTPYFREVALFTTRDGEILGAKVCYKQDGGSGDVEDCHFETEQEALAAGVTPGDSAVCWMAHIYYDAEGSLIEASNLEYYGD